MFREKKKTLLKNSIWWGALKRGTNGASSAPSTPTCYKEFLYLQLRWNSEVVSTTFLSKMIFSPFSSMYSLSDAYNFERESFVDIITILPAGLSSPLFCLQVCAYFFSGAVQDLPWRGRLHCSQRREILPCKCWSSCARRNREPSSASKFLSLRFPPPSSEPQPWTHWRRLPSPAPQLFLCGRRCDVSKSSHTSKLFHTGCMGNLLCHLHAVSCGLWRSLGQKLLFHIGHMRMVSPLCEVLCELPDSILFWSSCHKRGRENSSQLNDLFGGFSGRLALKKFYNNSHTYGCPSQGHEPILCESSDECSIWQSYYIVDTGCRFLRLALYS